MRAPNKKTCQLRAKLRELAARGVDGEREVAASKLAKLESRYDFSAAYEEASLDLFSGIFKPSDCGSFVCRFEAAEAETANFIKWAIEERAKIVCSWRYSGSASDLYAAAEPESIRQLQHVAEIIRRSFAQLWQEFSAAPSIDGKEKKLFLLGLYDGMMREAWEAGKPLPTIKRAKPSKERRKGALAAVGLALHPYNLALALGERIRLLTPLGEIVEQLQNEICRLKAA